MIGACASIIVVVFMRVLTMVSDRGRDNLDPHLLFFTLYATYKVCSLLRDVEYERREAGQDR
ncbi:MAG: hypothetical protein CM15mP74_03490 [Halieaceae bacterium]|nr:MAG: hypothetical protein CM15mP74_03490 [Halieaceae bacterium]